VLADDIALLLFEDAAADVPAQRGADGNKGRLGSEAAPAQDGELRGGHHGNDVAHGDVGLVVNALDGVGQVARLSKHHDASAHEDGHEEADQGDPKKVQILAPHALHIRLRQGVPQVLEQEEQNLVVDERG